MKKVNPELVNKYEGMLELISNQKEPGTIAIKVDGYCDLGYYIGSLLSAVEFIADIDTFKFETDHKIQTIQNLVSLCNAIIPYSELEFIDSILTEAKK